MVNGALHMLLYADDFTLQRGDPRVELGDRQRIEVLFDQERERFVGPRQILVGIHGDSVDRADSRVNNDAMGDTIPSTMRAIDPATPGGPEVLVVVERPVPSPGEGEVLVKVAVAGINRPEVLQRMGMYPPPPGAPSIPGMEIAGTIVACGPGTEPDLVGQPVCALISGGAYAEYACAPYGQCLPVPDALSMVEAAAMPETLFTVWTNLFERGYAAEGDTVLVHGGTSGIGTMAIALCNLFGVTIIVTAGSDEKCAAARAIGADHAINYKSLDFVAEVKAITGGAGCAVVLDMVGGEYVARNLQCLADDGRHVSIAVQGGAMATIPVFEVMRRRLTLTGSTLRPRSVEFKTAVADEIARMVWPHVEAGELKPVIDRTFALADAPDAHRRMEAGDHVGKIVLTIE
jgi:NADPH2:quinone reductase